MLGGNPVSHCRPQPLLKPLWSLNVMTTLLTLLPGLSSGHGRMMDPPSRNSMWRLGFSNPVNYNDNELYCGGRVTQWARNKGKCGVCGDAYHAKREHEVGGKYANGIVTRDYIQGDVIDTTIHITANHRGYFEFRLCPVSDPDLEVTQRCLDTNVLKRADDEGTKYFLPEGKSNQFFNISLILPPDVTCERCVIQWKYRTGNTWDKNELGEFCVGCGPQEEFYNCADVSIHPRSLGTKWQQRSGKATKIGAGKNMSAYGQMKAGYLSQREGLDGFFAPDTIYSSLGGINKTVSKDIDLPNTISDYNKRMYSHIIEKSRKRELPFGPVSVAFRWKAGKPKTEEAEKMYRRFGYWSHLGAKKSNLEAQSEAKTVAPDDELIAHAHSKTTFQPDAGSKYRGTSRGMQKKEPNLGLQGFKSPGQTMHRKPHLDFYVQSLESLQKKMRQASTSRKIHELPSESPFTPPPPDGDPDLLRIFPIHGESGRRRSYYRLAPTRGSPREVQAMPNAGSVYRPGNLPRISQTSRRFKSLPGWLADALKMKQSSTSEVKRSKSIRENSSVWRTPSKSDEKVMASNKTSVDKNDVQKQNKTCTDHRKDPSCLNRSDNAFKLASTDKDDRESRNHDSVNPKWSQTFSPRTSEVREKHGKNGDKNKVMDEMGKVKDYGSLTDSLETLIAFLLSLLFETSEYKNLDTILNEVNDGKQDSQNAESLGKGDPQIFTGSVVEDFPWPTETVFTRNALGSYQNPNTRQNTVKEKPWSSWYVPGLSRKSGNYKTENIAKTYFGRPINGAQKPRLQPGSSDGKVSFIMKDNAISSRNKKLPLDWFDRTEYEAAPGHIITSDVGFTTFTGLPHGAIGKKAWDSKGAKHSQSTLRGHRRNAAKRKYPRGVLDGNKYYFERPPVPQTVFTNIPVKGSRVQSYQPGQRQRKYLPRFKSLKQPGGTYQPLSLYQLHPKRSSGYSQTTFPHPYPISQPMTRAFPKTESIPTQLERQAQNDINLPSWKNSYSIDGRDGQNPHVVVSPHLSQLLDSIQTTGPYSIPPAVSHLPSNTKTPNIWRASTQLDTNVPLDATARSSEKPRHICKALIKLGGGMDKWCSDNCQARFCPPSTCICYTLEDIKIGPKPTAQVRQQPYSPQIYAQGRDKPARYKVLDERVERLSGPIGDSQLPFHIPYNDDALQMSDDQIDTFASNNDITPQSSSYRAQTKIPTQDKQVSLPDNPDFLNNYLFGLPFFMGAIIDLGGNENNVYLKPWYIQQDPLSFPEQVLVLNNPHATESSRTSIAPTSAFRSLDKSMGDGSNILLDGYNARDNSINGKSVNRINVGRRLLYSSPDLFYHERAGTPQHKQRASETPATSGCVAIGPYSGLEYFDEWCNAVCKKSMCPLLLCSCNDF
ncbi:cell wall integrity and stress response component 4-like [Plakobranchus ocellatus]|uniref:Cell wall integrity and stress response component 4-like n=1 Tax=Plakobranchus ocellatus TaxID=259542 RepID=A0AAV4CJT8_9GAST|nr:cell wall integrity and stress response component 4-like [Plakobranchus ocellatus]